MLELIISFPSVNWISYFSQIYLQISTNSSNLVFSIKIPKKSTENDCEESEITETTNWIRLLIFDDKS